MLQVDAPNALFQHAPSYLVRERFLVAMVTPSFQWISLWGRMTLDDLPALQSVLHAGQPHLRDHVALVDSRGLESVEPAALLGFVKSLEEIKKQGPQYAQREAHIRPTGFGGVIVSGYAPMFTMPYPVRVFDDVPDALAWLEVENPAHVRTTMEAIAEQARDAGGVLVRLHRVLGEQPVVATEEAAARAMGTSVRTLQRKLEAKGTTFGTELVKARVRRAMHLLPETDRALKDIAEEVGIASLSQFSEQFRRVAGTPPGQWRENARKPSGAR